MTDTSERMKGGAEVMRRVRAAIASMKTEEVVARLRAADVPVAPVRQLDEVADDPQVVASGTVKAFEHGVLGNVHQPRPAPFFDGATIEPTPTAPRLGEHTDEVLRELGYSGAEIAALKQEGAV
jgi:crotonobetainyl-CoA:carnitine CoA-transferase CaiB-like acyl-CoA transferase